MAPGLGYWYQNGVLFPLLTSISIAVDRATRRTAACRSSGAPIAGAVDHIHTGDQAGADKGRVAEILNVLPLIYVEMEPGDVLYFHAEPATSSDQNRSDIRAGQ